MNPTIKRYIVSSVVTFVGSFATTLGLAIKAGMLNPTSMTVAVVLSVIMVAVRAGAKAVIEYFVTIESGGGEEQA